MHEYLPPRVLAQLKNMPLVAKTLAQGFLLGRHNSVQRGTGIEFSQFRSYEPGDPLNAIDWKLFARSDRYFVREAERESNINLWLVLDCSLSMLQKSQASPADWHKLSYAKHLLASLAYIAEQQGDAFGLLGLSSQQLNFLPALAGRQQWQKCLLMLEQMQAGQTFPPTEWAQSHLAKMQSNSLIVFVSDFYQQDNEVLDLMHNLVGKRTDVVAMQLECDDEIQFPFTGQVRFVEQESSTHKRVSASEVKEDYLQAREQFNQDIKTHCQQHKIQHVRANIDAPVENAIAAILATRHNQ